MRQNSNRLLEHHTAFWASSILRARRIVMKSRVIWLLIPATLALSGIGFAQPKDSVKPLAVNPVIKLALGELLEQFQAFLREQGASDALKCEAPGAWLYVGNVDAAAEWIGKQIQKRGFEISSEGQLELSYGFTAQTGLVNHENDLMLGGIIERRDGVITYLQRCHPKNEKR
jgi:hypothetical protein